MLYTPKPIVKSTLQYKFQELTEMLPVQFQEEFKEKAFISGGSIYSLVNDEDVNDYDFFVTDEDFAMRLREYFEESAFMQIKNIHRGEYNGHNLIVTKYAITLGEFQIITKFTGTPQEVVEQFDFKHNMFAFVKGQLVAYTEWEYLTTDTLHFNTGRSRDICGTIMRIPKMVKKGFKVNKSEIAKMLEKLDNNGFDDREREIISDLTTY